MPQSSHCRARKTAEVVKLAGDVAISPMLLQSSLNKAACMLLHSFCKQALDKYIRQNIPDVAFSS